MAKKAQAVKEPMSKTALLSHIAAETGVARKDVVAVFEELENVIGGHLQKGGAGTFMLPGLLKVKTIQKPAQKARTGVPNPFKPGELMDVKAKPASVQVKVLALKKLKDMAM